jgi:hypothetical protein
MDTATGGGVTFDGVVAPADPSPLGSTGRLGLGEFRTDSFGPRTPRSQGTGAVADGSTDIATWATASRVVSDRIGSSAWQPALTLSGTSDQTGPASTPVTDSTGTSERLADRVFASLADSSDASASRDSLAGDGLNRDDLGVV